MENLEEGVGVVTSNVSNKDCFAASVVGVVMFLSLSVQDLSIFVHAGFRCDPPVPSKELL